MGRYHIEACLSAGPSSRVYHALDLQLGRPVALKIRTEPAPAALRHEARLLARLAHPNIVPVYDVGLLDGRYFFTMELVLGPTLGDWIRAPDRSPLEVCRVFAEAGRGLAAAHAQGISHRSFTHHNVLIGADGRARVINFGPSSAPFSDKLARADQFSFSAAFWQYLELTRASFPRHLRRALIRGMSIDPRRRFPSMTALVDALEGREAIARRAVLTPFLSAISALLLSR